MKSLVLIFALIGSVSAQAAVTIDTRNYTCAEAKALVKQQGIVNVLGRFGGYNEVVSREQGCGKGLTTNPVLVPTSDARSLLYRFFLRY